MRWVGIVAGLSLLTGCAGHRVAGPMGTPSASVQETRALALRKVFRRIDFHRFSGKRVYLAGWLQSPGKRWRSTPIRYLATHLAEGIVFAGGEIALEPDQAELTLFVRPERLGGQTTRRTYRFHGYPIYVHDEVEQAVRISIVGYDHRKGRYFDIVTGTALATRIEPYILDLFGFKVFW